MSLQCRNGYNGLTSESQIGVLHAHFCVLLQLKLVKCNHRTTIMNIVTWISRQHAEPGSWTEACIDVVFGLVAGQLRVAKLLFKSMYLHGIHPLAMAFGFHDNPIFSPIRKVENGTIKVALLGYGRTGTVCEMPFH